ncbi:MAG: hypothetical protein ABW121_02130, partial [Candidatus Thiodiazotropha sp. 6PLUC7]
RNATSISEVSTHYGAAGPHPTSSLLIVALTKKDQLGSVKSESAFWVVPCRLSACEVSGFQLASNVDTYALVCM